MSPTIPTTDVFIEVKAATQDKATRLADLAANHQLAPASHPRFPTKLTVRGDALRILALVYGARSENLLTADAAFDAVAELAVLLAQTRS